MNNALFSHLERRKIPFTIFKGQTDIAPQLQEFFGLKNQTEYYLTIHQVHEESVTGVGPDIPFVEEDFYLHLVTRNLSRREIQYFENNIKDFEVVQQATDQMNAPGALFQFKNTDEKETLKHFHNNYLKSLADQVAKEKEQERISRRTFTQRMPKEKADHFERISESRRLKRLRKR